MRRLAPALALAGTLVLTLSACSSGDSGPDSAAPATSPPAGAASTTAADPTADPAAEPAYNPCTDLGAAFVGKVLGAVVTEDAGTAVDPSCTYRPVVEGGPVLSVNYLVSDLDFEAAWASMGETTDQVTDLTIATADHARMVVNPTEDAVAATGFVQTGQVIETVNLVALAPYDQASIERATTRLLARLSATATKADS